MCYNTKTELLWSYYNSIFWGEAMNEGYTCCVTGHRKIPAEKMLYVQKNLYQRVEQAIHEGYVHFISGFASGVDLLFAEAVVSFKNDFPITLEAAIPYPGRLDTPDAAFRRLIKECDSVKVHATQYSKSCYMVRNRYMVDCSSLVIAVHDGRKTGGTAATVKYANMIGCLVDTISF